ncbi:MAG: 2'-5' RNA ligase family protein [Bdellovibrionales bacterium]
MRGNVALIQFFATFTLLSLHSAPSFAIKTLSHVNPKNQCFSLFSSLEKETYSSDSKAVEYEAIGEELFRSSVRARGPFQQPMGAMRSGILPLVFGTQNAVSRVRYDVGTLKDIVFDFTLPFGKDQYSVSFAGETGVVKLSPGLIGSSLISRHFSDLDAEVTLISESRGFRHEDFYNPDSVAVRSVENFVRQVISSNLEKGYIFSDFKAGEYDFIPSAADTTKSRAIKWELSDIVQGFKMIPQGHEYGPLRKISFREALASQSRIKFDWVAKINTEPEFAKKTGIQERYIELTVMVMLAGKRPGGTPVLKINNETQFPALGATGAHMGVEGTSSHLPVRASSIFFDPNHVELARQASVASPPPDVRYLNTVILNATKTYFERKDYLKILKILSTRMHFWNDYMYFSSDRNVGSVTSTSHQIHQLVNKIVADNTVVLLKDLYEVGKGIQLYRENGYSDLAGERQFLESLNRTLLNEGLIDSSIKFSSLDEAINFTSEKLSTYVLSRIEENPDLDGYIKYILSFEYTNSYDHYVNRPTFVTYDLPASVREKYSEFYNQLTEEYPHLTISRPEDLHMTVAFLGDVPASKLNEVKTLIEELGEKLQRYPIQFENGAIRLVGRNNSQVAVAFSEESVPREVLQAMSEFKAKAHNLGLKPDSHGLEEWLPHISIAHVRDAYFSQAGHIQISKLMVDDRVLDVMETVELPGSVRPLVVLDQPKTVPESARYIEYDPETIQTDLSPNDLF